VIGSALAVPPRGSYAVPRCVVPYIHIDLRGLAIDDRVYTLTRRDIMIFKAYPEEQRDMRWITVTMTSIATLLLICRIYATVRNRGWLGLEDAFVITANVGAKIR
jgi:hypothetical protein